MEAIKNVLEQELTEVRLQVEQDRKRVIIRIEERGAFPSGSADMTDDIPIKTARFHSNWDLSAARASSVANGLLATGAVEAGRLKVQGYAETRPRQ